MTTRWQLSLRGYCVAVAVLSVVLAYVGTYYRLSRRGASEAMEFGCPGFVYVPAEDIFGSVSDQDRKRAEATHFTRCRFFAPLNWLDWHLLGASRPAACLMRLSG